MASRQELEQALRVADAKAQQGDMQAKSDARKLAAALEPMLAKKPEISGMDKLRGFAQSFNRGSMLGWNDEIVGAGRALLDNILPDPGAQYLEGEDMIPNPAESDYKMYRDDERKVQGEFEDNYGKTALALNVAGGMLSPVNRIAPGWGVGSGGAGGAAGATLRAGTRAALESAAAGAGESLETDDMRAKAREGALWGLGTNLALRGLTGGTGRLLASNRIKEDLIQPDGTFKPLHLAGKGTLTGEAYRMLFGRIPGAKQKLMRQEEPFLEAARDKAKDLSDTWVRRMQDATMDKGAADRAATKTLDRLKRSLPRRVKDLEKRVAAAATNKADDIAVNFQTRAVREALPAHADADLNDVAADDIRGIATRVGDWWRSNGFDVVKKQTFPWQSKGAKELRAALDDLVENDPDLAIELGRVSGKLGQLSGRLEGMTSPGTGISSPGDILDASMEAINGDALMAIRNVFATGANGRSKNGSGLRAVANKIDDFIRANMDGESIKQFDDEIRQYTAGLNLMDLSRSHKVRLRGYFTPEEWASSAKKYGGKGMSTKAPPLDLEADEARRAFNATTGRAKSRTERIRTIKDRMLDKAKQTAETQKNINETRLNAQKRAYTFAKQEGDLAQAADELANLKASAVPERASALSSILSAIITGSAVPGVPKTRAAQAGAGMLVANMFAGEGTQLALAGQAEWQKKYLAALLRGDYAAANRAISRVAAMEGAD